MSVMPILDPVLGEIAGYGKASFVATLSYRKQQIQIVIPALQNDSASINTAALSSARRIARDLAPTVEQAMEFLATFRGFGDLAKVRAMFSFRGVVTTSKTGSFWLEFQCLEDRNPEAIWRVEFKDWTPTAQGRDD
jgi:hypothetical protein